MKLQNSTLFGSLLAILTFTSNASVDFTEQDLQLVRSACLVGSGFDFIAEASGAISVKNLEGRGKLHIAGKDLSVVDLPDEDKKKEFSEIRECIKDYLLKNKNTSNSEDKNQEKKSYANQKIIGNNNVQTQGTGNNITK